MEFFEQNPSKLEKEEVESGVQIWAPDIRKYNKSTMKMWEAVLIKNQRKIIDEQSTVETRTFDRVVI